MAPKSILILGGSYVGVSTAHYILKHVLPASDSDSDSDSNSYQVVLVSSSREILVRPAAPRALLSDEFFDQNKLFVSLEDQFKAYSEKFRFTHGTAKYLDHECRIVTIDQVSQSNLGSNEIQLEYHALIIGTGASTPSPLFSLNSAGASELKEHWKILRAALPNTKSIVIAGGGPVGIETAGELGEYLNGRAGWSSSGLKDPKVKIMVVMSADKILPQLRPAIAETAEQLLAKVGVEVIKSVKVEEADLFIPAYGLTPNTLFVQESLKASDGRIKTNSQTLRVEEAGSRVYAAGDASDYARPSILIINAAIPVLCANLKRNLLAEAGEAEDRLLKVDESETHLVPIAQSRGVGAIKGWKLPSFFVWLIKGRDYFVGFAQGTWSGKAWEKAIHLNYQLC